MLENKSVMEELFTLALYQSFKPEEKCRMFLELFPELSLPFFDWVERVKLSSVKKASFLTFRKKINSKLEIEHYHEMGLKWITILDEEYPEALKHTYGAPLLLFYMGDISLLKQSMLGVVGARKHTAYGKDVVVNLLPELVSHSIPIVSGLAKGIDTQAHLTTIQNGGQTIGVIGTGLDVYYPAQNRTLQKEIAKNQLLISEFPLGTKPKKHHFPYRNRIIAGLSNGIVVIEAQERSGSLITAHQALEEGRNVYAVPGSIFNSYSKGCNNLIKYGAKPVLSALDILEEW